MVLSDTVLGMCNIWKGCNLFVSVRALVVAIRLLPLFKSVTLGHDMDIFFDYGWSLALRLTHYAELFAAMAGF